MQVKFTCTIFTGIAYLHIIQVIYLQFFCDFKVSIWRKIFTGKLSLKIRFVACLFRQERQFHKASLWFFQCWTEVNKKLKYLSIKFFSFSFLKPFQAFLNCSETFLGPRVTIENKWKKWWTINIIFLTELKKFNLWKKNTSAKTPLNHKPQNRLVPSLHCSREKFASGNGRLRI